MSAQQNDQQAIAQAVTQQTAWENNMKAKSRFTDPVHANFLITCAKQIMGRLFAYDDEAPVTLNERMVAALFLPAIVEMQEYEEVDDIMQATSAFFNHNDPSNTWTATQKFKELVSDNCHVDDRIILERAECWNNIINHPYYLALQTQTLFNEPNDDAVEQTRSRLLVTLKHDTWDFFNLRWTRIVLRSTNSSRAVSKTQDYRPHLWLKDDDKFEFTAVLYLQWTVEESKRQKKNLAVIQGRWPLDKYLREKVFDVLIK